MDAEERRAPSPLTDAERARIEAARRRGLHPLVVLLERLRPGSAEVGGAASPGEERLRFRHDPSLAFGPSEVVRVDERTLPPDPSDFTAAPQRVLEVVTAFLGVTGTVSPLPQYVAEEVAQEDADAPRQRDFLDLFHHRVLSLLARGLQKHDPAASSRSDQTDSWSVRLLALLGVDVAARAPDAPAWQLLRAAPLLAERALTAGALEAILTDALAGELGPRARVEVEQFVGTWVEIAAADRTRLGAQASRLGQDVVLGGRVFDRAGKVAIVVGPLDGAGYARFAVSPDAVEKLSTLTRALTGGALAFDVVLALEPDAAPPLRLSGIAGSRLGRDAWLGRQGVPTRLRAEVAGA